MSKRLLCEIKIIEDEMKSDLSKGTFIIFGTEGTPYEGGIFHFTIEMNQTDDKHYVINGINLLMQLARN